MEHYVGGWSYNMLETKIWFGFYLDLAVVWFLSVLVLGVKRRDQSVNICVYI